MYSEGKCQKLDFRKEALTQLPLTSQALPLFPSDQVNLKPDFAIDFHGLARAPVSLLRVLVQPKTVLCLNQNFDILNSEKSAGGAKCRRLNHSPQKSSPGVS